MLAAMGIEGLEDRRLFSGITVVGVDPIPVPGPVVAPAISVAAGDQIRGTLGEISFPAAPTADQQKQFQVRIDWGDGYISRGQLTAVGNNQFDLIGAHVYYTPGNYTVNAEASYDGYPLFTLPGQPVPEFPQLANAYANLQKAVTVTGSQVEPVRRGIVAHPVGPLSGYGDALPLTELATLTGVQPDRLGADVYARIYTGNGNPQSYAVDYENGQYVLRASLPFSGAINHHNFLIPQDGAYTLQISFLLNDHADPTQNTLLASTQDTLNVIGNTANGLNLTATAGQPFSGSAGTFSADPSRKLQDAMIFWGDTLGDVTPGTLVPLGNNQYSIVGTHTFAEGDTYGIHVQIDYLDGNPLSDAIVSTIQVTPSVSATPTPTPPPTPAPPPFSATAVAGHADAGMFTLPLRGATAVAPDVTAVIRWGDGTRSAVPVDFANQSLSANASHTYKHAGKFNATVIYYSGHHVIGRLHQHVKVAHAKRV